MLLSIIGYAILLLFIYAFVFYEITQKEAGELASYYRYMGSLLLAFFFFFSILVYNSKNRHAYYALVLLVFFVLVLPRSFFSNLTSSKPIASVENRLRIGNQFDAFIENENVKSIAFMTYNNIEDITQYHLKYELLPVQTNSEPITFVALTTSKTIPEIKKKLDNYDMIIIKEEKSQEIQQFFMDNGILKRIFILQ
jgi:Ca2+/Na+ antiporter